MYRDYPVDERSDAQIRAIAKLFRSNFAIVDEGMVDLIACLKKTRIRTQYGDDKALRVERRPDNEMAGSEGMTLFEGDIVTIVLPESTFKDLEFGDGRARNTVAHELAHAVLHKGPPMHRGLGSTDKLRWLPPYRSAEHQAKVFAPAFLIDNSAALVLADETEVAIKFGVSVESAKIYLRELRRPEERKRVSKKLRDFSRILELANKSPPFKIAVFV